MPTITDTASHQPVQGPSSADPRESVAAADPRFIQVKNYSFFYGAAQALQGIELDIPERQVSAFIGPSGCGKSTLLRNLNRMNDLIDDVHHTGDITLKGRSLYDPDLEVIALRKRIGMVFQKSNPFPKSIYENVAFGPKVNGVKRNLPEIVESSLRAAALPAMARLP